MTQTHLIKLGWEHYINNNKITIPENNAIGRIAAQYNELYSVLTGEDEVVETILFLLSDNSQAINATEIVMDGGLTATK